MPKIQRHFSRKVGDKIYSKWVVVLPEESIDKSGFKEGEEVEMVSEKGKIVIKKKK